ncbi:hypothetical protein SAMN05421594_2628 [Chryseobacterium oleae]|uniref:Pyrroline-5-carboxylate reductase catalytic N-terminal domain-containing protein n=1 Tax=Chryseobacterium oleae TaxID=491207 RepID=A0A1I4YS58_CHROL|nr:NAD(P)-binding domain-containing protein [Chryseobacterium oleae]SFN40603.1 hypothetical protein SAMN05421594_2628 [Chryseobacterium oleae]
MSVNEKVAIIGLGNIGKALASNLLKSNTSYIVADRNEEEAKNLAALLGSSVEANSVALAVKAADVLILAVPFQAISGFLKDNATYLENKIIVDPSNAIAPDGNGGFKKIIGEDESAGEINAGSLPKGAKLVKAFGTLLAGTLQSASFQTPEKAVEFYASDDESIDSIVEQLIMNNGFDPVRIGGLNQSARIEVFGDLHEAGGLGKTVTLSEAKSKL